MPLVTSEAFTIAIVLKDLYFLLYPDKLNITGYCLSLVPAKALGQARN